MKTISWLTASCFVDVDFDIVPRLAKKYKINWYIWSEPSEADKERLLNLPKHENLKLEFLHLKWKYNVPFSFMEYIENLRRCQNCGDLMYVDVTGGYYFYQALNIVADKAKTILAIHNVNTPKGANHEKIARFNTRYAIKHFPNIQTFSLSQYNLLKRLSPKVNALQAPLVLKDYGEATEVGQSDVFNFLMFGHIREYKRVDLLIKAAEELSKMTNKEFKVTIAGRCTNWNEYQNLITKPELFDIHVGFVENKDIPNYFAKADAFVLPYQDLAQSGAITVAFRYNVPVISSDIEQFQEFNGDSSRGWMFKSEDYKSLTGVMLQVINTSTKEMAEIKKRQNEFVKLYLSTDSILKRYIDYLEKF